MEYPEKPVPLRKMPKVSFANEPVQSPHKVDENFNAMRKAFIPHIQNFVERHELFKDEEHVGISFAQKGVSSIIAIIESSNHKFVLKIPRSNSFSAGEGQFLSVWENEEVRVPHVFETGDIKGSSYLLMEYVDAPLLSDVDEADLRDRNINAEMGEALRAMHRPKTEGFGSVIDGRAEFATVEEWFEHSDIQSRIAYVTKNELLGPLASELPQVLETVKQHAGSEQSSYCHTDFKAYNIFATDPITVFDANPKFHNRYFDLGLVMLREIADTGSDHGARELLDTYFGEEECNEEALRAYTILATLIKFRYWHETKKDKLMQNVIKYFSR